MPARTADTGWGVGGEEADEREESDGGDEEVDNGQAVYEISFVPLFGLAKTRRDTG